MIRDKTFQNLGAPLNIKTVSDHKPDVPRTFDPFFPPMIEGEVFVPKENSEWKLLSQNVDSWFMVI